MIELVGWKRYEVNSMVRFSGVTERSVPSAEDAMREACGLQPRQRSDQVHADINVPADKSSQDERDHLHEQLKNVLPAIMEHCLEKSKSFITKGMWKYIKLPPDHPSHMGLWDALLRHNLLCKLEQKNDEYKDAAMPIISFDAAFRQLMPIQADSPQITHEEVHVHDLEAARQNIIGNGDRESNVVKKVTENEKMLTRVMEIDISEEMHQTMEACAKNRDEIIRDELKMSRKQGKKLLHQVYERVIAIEKMSNPAASTQFYLYAAVEDYVLASLEPCAMVEKRQLFFKELCASPVERVEEQIDAELLKRGNCIPLAVARLLPAKKAQILQALTAANHKNAEAEQSGSRCYNFLLKEMSIWAAPQLGLDTPKPGNYNLSMEDKGTPLHRLLLLPQLVQFSEEAIDSNTIVSLQLFENDVEREQAKQTRLDDECDIGGSEGEEPVVHPGDHLLSLLCKEVQQLTSNCTKQRKCPFCPFRSFHWPSRVNKHVPQYHTAAQQYVANGTKQLKLRCALYDQDQTLGAGSESESYIPVDLDSLLVLGRPGCTVLLRISALLAKYWRRYATWVKTTPGGVFLRKIMNKLNMVDHSMGAEHWGGTYRGSDSRPLNQIERTRRTSMETSSMQKGKASKTVEDLDPTVPFRCRLEFIEALAALSAVFSEEFLPNYTSRTADVEKVRKWNLKRPAAPKKTARKRTVFTAERAFCLRRQPKRFGDGKSVCARVAMLSSQDWLMGQLRKLPNEREIGGCIGNLYPGVLIVSHRHEVQPWEIGFSRGHMLCDAVSHHRMFAVRALQDQQLQEQNLDEAYDLEAYKEFRVHNALFAMRHLVATALGIWAPDWWLRQPGIGAVAAKVCLVLATCKAADITTEQIGSTDDRTTNSMPYPKKTPETLEKVAKRFYAKSQFAATALAVFGTPSSSFCAILAIEIASFLMTLVRKGIIEARTYHILYAASLFIMFPVLVATLHSGDAVAEAATLRCLFVGALGIDIRIKYRFSKYTAWLVAIPAGYILADTLSMYANTKLFFAWPGMMWSASDTLRGFFQARQQSNAFTAAHEGEVSKEILNESPVTSQSEAVEGLEGSSAKEADAAGHSFPYVRPSCDHQHA
ncbi:unnamed protein product [Symbiodinium sp. KB8]|nr:unnamed protein product [Symbiodinium sp. KB8]